MYEEELLVVTYGNTDLQKKNISKKEILDTLREIKSKSTNLDTIREQIKYANKMVFYENTNVLMICEGKFQISLLIRQKKLQEKIKSLLHKIT